MLHAAIARPQRVVALIGIASAVDGLVTKFNQLPVEVSHRQPQCIPHNILLLLIMLAHLKIYLLFLYMQSLFFSIWSLV